MYDARIGRWHAPDNVKIYKTQYAGMGNNPINIVDPDGNDIIILNHSSGAYGGGHLALLIGNDKNGWRFISKGGRIELDNGDQDGTIFTGGKSIVEQLPLDGQRFNTLEEALNHSDIKHYNEAIRILSDDKTDNLVYEGAKAGAEQYYHVVLNNCADAVSCGLFAGGFNPGYTNIDESLHKSFIPNVRFSFMLSNNNATFLNLNNLRKKGTVEAEPAIFTGVVNE